MFTDYDIIFLNECWISYKSRFELNVYSCFLKARTRKKRAKRDSGGLCIFIKNEISKFFELVEWDNEDCLILKVKSACTNIDKDLYLFFCYMRPSTSTRNSMHDDLDIFDLLFNKISEFRNDNEIILVGDFNSRCNTLSDLIIDDSSSNFDPIDELVSNVNCITKNDLFKRNIPFFRKKPRHKIQ